MATRVTKYNDPTVPGNPPFSPTIPDPTVPGNPPFSPTIPDPTVPGNPPAVPISYADPAPTIKPPRVPNTFPPPPVELPKDYDRRPAASDDRVEWTPVQLEFFKSLWESSFSKEPLDIQFNYPELSQSAPTGANALEKGVNSALALGRFLFQGANSAVRLTNFLKYHVLTGKNKTGASPKKVRKFLDALSDPSSGEALSWEKFGFNAHNTKLALPEKAPRKEKNRVKEFGHRPTYDERYKSIKDFVTQLNLIKSKTVLRTDTIKKINPKLYLEILGMYRSRPSNPVRIVIPFFFIELEYTPESKFSPINVLGRNLKRYHYSGAEDSLELKIILKKSDSVEHPIALAKELANLTKANFDGETPIISISFQGVSDNSPFFFPFDKNKYYILTKAPFKPTRFRPVDLSSFYEDDGMGNMIFNWDNSDSIVAAPALSQYILDPEPMYIEQTLSFKRIAESPHEIYG